MATEDHLDISLIPLDRPPSPRTINYPVQALQDTSKPELTINTNYTYHSASPSLPPNPPPTPKTPTDDVMLSYLPSRDTNISETELPPSPPPSPPLRQAPSRQQSQFLELSREIMESKEFSSSVHGKPRGCLGWDIPN